MEVIFEKEETTTCKLCNAPKNTNCITTKDLPDLYAFNAERELFKATAKDFLESLNEKILAKNISKYKIKDVIFNGPATIVIWEDNTKTIVRKREEDDDDRLYAIQYAYYKRLASDIGIHNSELRKFAKKAKKREDQLIAAKKAKEVKKKALKEKDIKIDLSLKRG